MSRRFRQARHRGADRLVRVGCGGGWVAVAGCGGYVLPGGVDPPEPTKSPNPSTAQLRARVSARGGEIAMLLGGVVPSPFTDVSDSYTCTAPPQLTSDGYAGTGYEVRGQWTVQVAPSDQAQRINAVYEIWKKYYRMFTVLPDYLAAVDDAEDLNMRINGSRPEVGLVVTVAVDTCYPAPETTPAGTP